MLRANYRGSQLSSTAIHLKGEVHVPSRWFESSSDATNHPCASIYKLFLILPLYHQEADYPHHYDVLIFSGPIPVSLTFTSCFASQQRLQPATFKQEWLEGEISINYSSDQGIKGAEDRRRGKGQRFTFYISSTANTFHIYQKPHV